MYRSSLILTVKTALKSVDFSGSYVQTKISWLRFLWLIRRCIKTVAELNVGDAPYVMSHAAAEAHTVHKAAGCWPGRGTDGY